MNNHISVIFFDKIKNNGNLNTTTKASEEMKERLSTQN